jgi:hypothetical protein
VVVFDEPIKGIEPAQLPTEGQLAGTPKGAKFTPVGYGDTSGYNFDGGVRRYAPYTTFKSLNRTYLSTSQHRGSGGTCYGDSGGPNFLGEYPYDYDNNPDTENVPIIAGTTITGDTWCKATNVTLRLDTGPVQTFLSAYVTPCSDGVDNDNDGKIDFGTNGDPGCTSKTDLSQRSASVLNLHSGREHASS